MKRFYKSLFLFALTITFLFTSACAFINRDAGDNSEEENGPETSIIQSAPGLSSELLVSSFEKANSVVFKENVRTSTAPLTKKEAVDKVLNANVEISIKASETSTGASWGSGVIIDVEPSSGSVDGVFYVITCQHITANTGFVSVYLPDDNGKNYGDTNYKKEYVFSGTIDNTIRENRVTLVGGDNTSDISVLKLDLRGSEIDYSHLDKAQVASKENYVTLGEEVFAIGNPTGELPGSVSFGVISYMDYRTHVIESVGKMNLLQIDVSTNPGNSGGGLYNLYGELVGITNAGDTSSQGINFAIPAYCTNKVQGVDNGFVNIVKNLVGTATENNFGYVSGRWNLGLTFSSDSNSVIVNSIIKDSNGYTSGIKLSDKFLSITYMEDQTETKYDIVSMRILSNVICTMRYYLSTGDSFQVRLLRQKNSGTSEEKVITIQLDLQYIFCDTGNYNGQQISQ